MGHWLVAATDAFAAIPAAAVAVATTTARAQVEHVVLQL
jgi:hypothetical protein